jgi:ABC-type multidrug transport system fused ATPase/permease subunit
MSLLRIITTLRDLFWRLGGAERRSLILLVFFMTMASMIELFAIAAIFPFLAVLTGVNGKLVSQKIDFLDKFLVNIDSADASLFITLAFVIIIILANVTRLMLHYLSIKTGFKIGTALNNALFGAMLTLPYDRQVSVPTSETIANVTAKSGIIIFNVITPCVNIISVSILILLASFAMVLSAPVETLGALIFLTLTYAVVNGFVKYRMYHISSQINEYTTRVIREIQETFGMYREVTLYRLQRKYQSKYSKADSALRSAQANASFLAGAPKYILETIAVVSLAALAYSSRINDQNFLPVLGLIAFAVQRLLPQLQQGYSSWTSIQSSQHVLIELNEVLAVSPNALIEFDTEIKLKEHIFVKSIQYSFPDEEAMILKGVNLSLRRGRMIAITGASGTGKSVLVDTICGLRSPATGEIYIDEVKLTSENRHNWCRNVAYVAQAPFLFEGTIRRNISQSIDGEPVDFDRLKSSAQNAEIHEWIEDLPDKYDTVLFEHGKNLSGGQRQRICIARALYRNAQLLCLDESSNALDELTEDKLYKTLKKLKSDMVILVVTHKVSSFHFFDEVYKLQDGKLEHVR